MKNFKSNFFEFLKQPIAGLIIIGLLLAISCGIGKWAGDISTRNTRAYLSSVSASESERSSKSETKTDSYGHDRFDAIVIAKDKVKGQLKSPSTAKFCGNSDYTVSCSGNTWTVKGWVDAQNSFGATLRNNFTVKITFTGKDKYTTDSCTIS